MDFAKVLKTIVEFSRNEGFPLALIGAFGLHAYGLSRATRDLDFAVDIAAQDKLLPFLESLGYRTLYCSAGYSSHEHESAPLGRVDFVYLSGETSRRVFGEARHILEIEDLTVPVPRPGHLIAMKVHAIKNDPSRTLQDLADIQFLMSLPGIDEAEIRSYFEKSDLSDLYERVKEQTG
jgi:predicted nucleotidyltransferase